MNCKYCNKGFSCGCQKTTINGVLLHKTCVKNYEKAAQSNQLNQLKQGNG